MYRGSMERGLYYNVLCMFDTTGESGAVQRNRSGAGTGEECLKRVEARAAPRRVSAFNYFV